jgi:hypothetical protein
VTQPGSVERAGHLDHAPGHPRRAGRPTNREPATCSAVRWFPLTALPDQLIGYPAAGIHAYLNQVPFSVCGWIHPAVQTGVPA